MKNVTCQRAMRCLLLGLIPVITLLLTSLPASAAFKFHADRTDVMGDPVVFDGNVRIEQGNRTLSADRAEVDRSTAMNFLMKGLLPGSDEEVADLEVWLSGNISVVAEDVTIKGDTAHVVAKAHTAVVEGNMEFSREGINVTADHATYNWDSGLAEFEGNVHLRQDGKSIEADRLFYDAKKNKVL